MTKVEIGLEDMATELSNIKNMLEKIFVAVSGGGQVNGIPATSTNNNNNISL